MAVTERIACLSIATNLLLVAIKAGLALLSGSLAIKADAIHSLTDVTSSVIILLGIKIAQRPARGFPLWPVQGGKPGRPGDIGAYFLCRL